MPSSPNSPLRYRLLDHQIRALNAQSRIIALVGGTGAGKTWFAPHWIYHRMRQKPGSRFMAVGMQYERHVINLMQKQLTDFFDEVGEQYKLVIGKRLTLLSNGCEILFGSAQNPDSLEGPHFDGGIWMDEAGLMSRLAYDVLTRRTGAHSVPMLITTIPYVFGWLKTDVYDMAMKGDPDITWIPCRSIDNPNYSVREIERRKATMRPEKFATYYLGEWSKPFGAIYPEPDDSDLTIAPFHVPEHWPAFAGHDYGIAAPTTGIWARWDEHGEGPTGIADTLYIVGEYQQRGMTMETHVENWKADGLDVVDMAFGDAANPEAWLIAEERGYPVRAVAKGEKSVPYGINVGFERMKSGRLKVFEGCKGFIDYRKRYVWDANPLDDEDLLERPKKPQAAEHLMDAYRYLCVGMVDEGLSRPGSIIDIKRTQLGQAA
jgi:hypothetical protein